MKKSLTKAALAVAEASLAVAETEEMLARYGRILERVKLDLYLANQAYERLKPGAVQGGRLVSRH